MKSSPKLPVHTFMDALQDISDVIKKQPQITLKEIFHLLAGKGYAALLIVFGLPFCFPIQIPGMSTPFGIVLAFLGLRIAFAKKPWWPRWVLEKSITSEHTQKLVVLVTKAVNAVKGVVHPRLLFITQEPLFHQLHGLLVCFLGTFLALPLPIPFTNLLTAIPIVLMGIGLLEDDGLLVILAYTLAFAGFAFFIGLFMYGRSYLMSLS